MAQFVITKGREFECIFPIKEPNSPTPMNLTGAAGTFTLTKYDEENCAALLNITMEVYDSRNGKFKLKLTAEETSNLESKTAFAEDGYPLAATYSALLDISHPIHGKIFARIPQVYIYDTGTVICEEG
jgi:hypothetical protein